MEYSLKPLFLHSLGCHLFVQFVYLPCVVESRSRDEFVMRLQPSEAMYMKLTVSVLTILQQ